jgi:hypothetical protein
MPAVKSAYPTHRLGGIAIPDIDSISKNRVPNTPGPECEARFKAKPLLAGAGKNVPDPRNWSELKMLGLSSEV